jgi:hypothetical protein
VPALGEGAGEEEGDDAEIGDAEQSRRGRDEVGGVRLRDAEVALSSTGDLGTYRGLVATRLEPDEGEGVAGHLVVVGMHHSRIGQSLGEHEAFTEFTGRMSCPRRFVAQVPLLLPGVGRRR